MLAPSDRAQVIIQSHMHVTSTIFGEYFSIELELIDVDLELHGVKAGIEDSCRNEPIEFA